jgi:hypothetical protein
MDVCRTDVDDLELVEQDLLGIILVEVRPVGDNVVGIEQWHLRADPRHLREMSRKAQHVGKTHRIKVADRAGTRCVEVRTTVHVQEGRLHAGTSETRHHTDRDRAVPTDHQRDLTSPKDLRNRICGGGRNARNSAGVLAF